MYPILSGVKQPTKIQAAVRLRAVNEPFFYPKDLFSGSSARLHQSGGASPPDEKMKCRRKGPVDEGDRQSCGQGDVELEEEGCEASLHQPQPGDGYRYEGEGGDQRLEEEENMKGDVKADRFCYQNQPQGVEGPSEDRHEHRLCYQHPKTVQS